MIKEILYTTAIDENENLIHVDNAEKGINYYCPLCKKDFILRKSGKTGKGSKRPHFAHNELTTNCTPEGVLHFSFKEMLFVLLENYISNNKKLMMNWICGVCNNKHSENLLEKVASVKKEYNLKVCQPDIALLDEKENILAFIEIVVTHKPEENVWQYCAANNIILIQINLSSEEDLYKVEEKIKNPDFVDFCLNPECLIYEKYKIERKLIVYPKRCNNCFNIISTCHVEINHFFGVIELKDFNKDEIESATSQGVKFENKMDKKHPVIICLNCKRKRLQFSRTRRF